MTKIEALAKYLEVDTNEIDVCKWDGTFKHGRYEYFVLTDSEADSKAREYILESVWAFNPDFLASHAKGGIDADTIKSIQDNGRYEDNNRVLLSLIDDVDHFIDDAIKSDGRGHFLNTYNGEEHEVYHTTQRIDKNGITQNEYQYFYIYRLN